MRLRVRGEIRRVGEYYVKKTHKSNFKSLHFIFLDFEDIAEGFKILISIMIIKEIFRKKFKLNSVQLNKNEHDV